MYNITDMIRARIDTDTVLEFEEAYNAFKAMPRINFVRIKNNL